MKSAPTYPLSLFPFAQARIRAMLEDADEERAACQHRWADYLINKARDEAQRTLAAFGETSR